MVVMFLSLLLSCLSMKCHLLEEYFFLLFLLLPLLLVLPFLFFPFLHLLHLLPFLFLVILLFVSSLLFVCFCVCLFVIVVVVVVVVSPHQNSSLHLACVVIKASFSTTVSKFSILYVMQLGHCADFFTYIFTEREKNTLM